MRKLGCAIAATAEATARSICAQIDTHVGIFGGSAWDEDDSDLDDGVHLAIVTNDAYVTVSIAPDGESMLSRCSTDDAYHEGVLVDIADAVAFLRDHQTPNNHPELMQRIDILGNSSGERNG